MIKEKMSTNWSTLILCFVCTFFWGAGYPVLKISYEHWAIESHDVVGKLLFAGIRFAIAGLLLVIFSSIRKRSVAYPPRKALPKVVALGFCQTVFQYGLLYIGMALTSGTKGSLLNQINVFLLVLLTPLFYRNEKLSVRKVLGCVLGFSGIIIMNLHGLSFTLESGDIIVVISSTFAALGYLISKSMPADSDPMVCTAYQQLLGGIVLIIIGIAGKGRITTVNWQGICCLIFLIMVAAVAYTIWFYLLQHNDVSRVSIYKFLTPLIGVVLSGLLLGEEVFTIANVAALLLVCIGIIIVNGAPKQKKLPA